MKKTKLLMLGTIAPLSAVLPLVATTSCNDGSEEPASDNKFVCEDKEQETVRGETACWYIFDYKGNKNIPDDIDVDFLTGSAKLNPQLLVQKINEKTIKVGVQGLRPKLSDKEEVQFVLQFKSVELGIDGQQIDCKYTYLESKVRAISPMVEERENTVTQFRVDAEFVLTNESDEDNLIIEIENAKRSDELTIGEPETDGEVIKSVDGHIHQAIKVAKDGNWSDGDWVQFDLHFVCKTKGKEWEQTITGYTYQVLQIPYVNDNLDESCDIQIDIKGNTAKGLKAVDAEGNGILTTDTEVNSPFSLTFDKKDTPAEWTNIKSYKFGSFVNPDKYSGGYHHYASVMVKVKTAEGSLVNLTQTYTGDTEGVYGEWWISTGGPITVLKDILDKKYENWQSLTFELRTTQKIEHNTSFYIIYSDK